MRWYNDNMAIKLISSPTIYTSKIFDSNPKTYAENNNEASSSYIFEAEAMINFKSLVLLKRFDGMRDRYQGKTAKHLPGNETVSCIFRVSQK